MRSPSVPCVVGPAPYYKVWQLNTSMVLRDRRGRQMENIIYTFNFFVPKAFVDGETKSSGVTYPGPMPCCDLHDKEHRRCCPHESGDLHVQRCCTRDVMVDAAALESDSKLKAMAVRLELSAGEAAFIPEGWWHEVVSPEEATLAINWWWPGPLEGAGEVQCGMLSSEASIELLMRAGGCEHLLNAPPKAAFR